MKTGILNRIRVASPCTARWEDMDGDERSRFCAHCSRRVYNLSGLTESQVAGLIETHEGRLCGRFHRRRDGTMLTADCPVGTGRVAARLKLAVGALGCAVVLTVGALASTRARGESQDSPARWRVEMDRLVWKVKGWLGIKPQVVMGVICLPAPPASLPPPVPQSPAPLPD